MKKTLRVLLVCAGIQFAPYSLLADDDDVLVPGLIYTNDMQLPGDALAGAAFVFPPSPLGLDRPESPVTSTNFLGAGDSLYLPPDTMGAVGTNRLMMMLNGVVVVRSRTGAGVSTNSLNAWWGGAASLGDLNNNFAYDPRITYDPFKDRWIASAAARPQLTNAIVLIGASATGDPAGAWYQFAYRVSTAGTHFADFPTLGFNKDKVVVQWSQVPNVSGSITSVVMVVDKATLFSGVRPESTNGTLGLLYLSPDFGTVLLPAQTYDTNQSTIYFVQSYAGSSGHLAIYSLTGTVASPVMATNAYPTGPAWRYWSGSANFAPQLGTPELIDTGDDRMGQVVYRSGSLWCAHTIFLPTSVPTHAAVQWWQLNPANGAAIQRGVIEDTSAKTNYAYPSIAVNRFQDVMIGYSSFASNQYASANYSFHAFNDAPGSMQAPALLKAGISAYWRTSGEVRNRWGDYSATVVDPVNDTDLWTLQEYAAQYAFLTNGGRWGIWWGKVSPPVPANDSFSSSFLLSGMQGATNGTTIRATRESGEPSHAGNANTPSVWYRWVVNSNMNVTVDTVGSAVDTSLAVYTGTNVTNLTLIASDHGSVGGIASRVVFAATSGSTYQVAVAGWNGAAGAVVLGWNQPIVPFITTQPRGWDVYMGTNVTFGVTAIGAPDPGYQWRSNGVNLSGANSTNYTKTNVGTNDSGDYSVVATNTSGSTTSVVAHLEVYDTKRALLSAFGYLGNQMQFTVSGITGGTYAVEVSTNLVDWSAVTTNVTTFTNTDFAVTNYRTRFYRARYLP